MLQAKCGIDFALYKAPTVTRRVLRRREFSDKATLAEYIARLRVDPGELERLYCDLLIGVTVFFRDSEAFEILAGKVLPELERLSDGSKLRVWVAACATGEEVYSLAILLDEHRRRTGAFEDFTVFATDVHETSLAKAREGYYEEDKFDNVSQDRISQYFAPESGGYKIKKSLRNRVVFAAHNLLEDAPFTKLDLITCRNLLIYIEPKAQQGILATFHYALRPKGVLFLGPSESLGELGASFEIIDQRWKIYRRTRHALSAVHRRLPSRASSLTATRDYDSTLIRRASQEGTISRGYDALLSRCMTSGILIDDRQHVLHFFGGADAFFEFRGRMSDDVLQLVKESLRTALAAAIHRVHSDRVAVVYRSVPCPIGGDMAAVDVAVEPLTDPKSKTKFLLVTLSLSAPVTPPIQVDVIQTESVSQATDVRLRALEDELRVSRANLQATIEESETTNEELHATNEELISSNEELKSTNEELQSVNEELFTVNAEYQQKIAQLTQVTNDVNNLLSSTEIGTIFLDRTTAIRKFTTAAARSFSLLPQDLGRPLRHITHNLDYPELLDDVEQLLSDETPCAKEIRTRDGAWFLVRLSPYRTDDNSADGVVITLVDIDGLKAAEKRISESNNRYRSLFEASEASLWECDVTGLVKEIENMAPTVDGLRVLLTESSDTIRDLWGLVDIVEVNRSTLRTFEAQTKEEFFESRERVFTSEFFPFFHDLVIAIAQGKTRFEAIATLGTLKERRIKTHLMFSLLPPELATTRAIVSIMDITAELEADLLGEKAAELQRSNNELERFAYVASHDLQAPLRTVVNYLQLLTAKTPDLADAAKGYIATASASALRMKEQIDALLEFSLVNKPGTEPEAVSIDELLNELKGEFIAAHGEQDITFDFTEMPTLMGHKYQFTQIFQNLISNSIKFRSKAPLVVRISSKQRKPGWLFEVQDNGIGMPTEQIERIFDVFTRLHPRDEYPGAGIGLANVRRVVEYYGGRIWVNSALGSGSRFTFTLNKLEAIA